MTCSEELTKTRKRCDDLAENLSDAKRRVEEATKAVEERERALKNLKADSEHSRAALEAELSKCNQELVSWLFPPLDAAWPSFC